ncbi:hypothetical protein Ahy_A10g050718 isoform A [Arachis hypogaea]|uniref:Uncharacterized protein n=1 Tax=Arachis hypogaea TaxID=3818 RepID=A0A445BA83_ARAHY|nr:hypothetical protein Ahy_A10g050718 isoform A [Arachis hypogaea]
MFIAPPSSNFLSVAARFHLLRLNIRCTQLMGVYDKLGLQIYWFPSSWSCLLRVLRKENSILLTASSVFLPVHPMMVSVIHTRLMELTSQPEAPDRAVAQWHLWKSVVAEWCAVLEEEMIRRS